MIEEIEIISMLDYINLQDKSLYNYVSNYSSKLNEPKDVFKFDSLKNKTFGEVKDIQYFFQKGINWMDLINFVETYCEIDAKESVKTGFFEWCQFRRYIESELDGIYKIEMLLNYQSTGKDESAGIDKLAKYGVLIQIDQLALNDITKRKEVRAINYMEAFTKLLKDKEIDEYTQQLNKIK